MDERTQILDNAIINTVNIIESKFNLKLDNRIHVELFQLLDVYLSPYQSNEELIFSAECWGGGVWDTLFHKDEQFQNILVLNYFETSNYHASPVLAQFPHQELNDLCSKTLQELEQDNLCSKISQNLNM
jgi:hypothetical protein